MLTIEEQIERIADLALERASVPERPPRRWPAMAAAAVVLLAAGSVVWAVSDRRPGDAGVASSEAPSLSARLAGAQEYPLTATEADDSTSTGLVIEQPDTLAAVKTSEGVTVFRASGLMTAPGTKVYQARCVGIPQVSVGCDVPAFADLPWVAGTPFVPEAEALSIWVDVPAGTAAVLITDGTVVRWQEPLAGLAVWPQPTDPGWRAEALDVTGDTILMVDESTKEQLRTAATEAFDPTETTAGDQAVLQQVRDCLVANGAKFGADNVRPVVAPGVSAHEIWKLCVGPLFKDGAQVDSRVPVDDKESLVLPTVLPDGWRVLAVSRTSSIGRPAAEQVFGRYEGNEVVGIRVVVSQNEFLGVAGGEEIQIRSQIGGISGDDTGWQVQWGDSGVLVDVTSRGLDRESLLDAIESLEFRTDAVTGFDPASAPAELPLVSEAITNEATPQVTTWIRLTQSDDLPSATEAFGTGSFENTITISINDRTGRFGSAPAIIFDGERRGDLVVATDPGGGSGLAGVLGDGSVAVVRVPDRVEGQVAESILGGITAQPVSAVLRMLDDVSARLALLPEVRAAVIDDQHTFRLRGGTTDTPLAMCLEVVGVERCNLALVASPIGDPTWVNGVVIDGRWYLYGFEPAEQGWLTIAPWRAGETLDPLSATGSVVEGFRYWFNEIPDDVDDVRVLDLPSVPGQETTFRRPDR